MSFDEFEKLKNGETLVNNTNHGAEGRHTNSIGFCFFDVDFDDIEDLKHEICMVYEFASGIVSDDVVVVFDTSGKELNKGYGTYANPYGAFFDTMLVDEYSTTEYSKYSLKPLFYAKANNYCDDEFDFFEWEG